MKRSSAITGLLWVSPWLIGFLAFTMLPLGMGIWYSFTDWTLLEPAIPIGTDNYERLLGDEVVRIAIWNTVLYLVISIPLLTIASIAMAVPLSSPNQLCACSVASPPQIGLRVSLGRCSIRTCPVAPSSSSR